MFNLSMVVGLPAAFSSINPQSRTLATVSRPIVRKIIRNYTSAYVTATFSKDGRSIAMGSIDGKVRVLRLPSLRLKRMFHATQQEVKSLSFAQNDNMLVQADRSGIYVWDLRRGTLKNSIHINNCGTDVNPDGKSIAVFDGKLQILNLSQPQYEDSGSTKYLCTVRYNLAGDLIAVLDNRTQVINLYNASDGRLVRSISDSEGEQATIAFSRDGRVLAVGKHNGARVWDASTGRLLWSASISSEDELDDWVTDLAATPDGRTLIGGSGNGRFFFWNIEDGKLRSQCRSLDEDRDPIPMHSMVMRPDGKQIATLDADAAMRIWDIGFLNGIGTESRISGN